MNHFYPNRYFQMNFTKLGLVLVAPRENELNRIADTTQNDSCYSTILM